MLTCEWEQQKKLPSEMIRYRSHEENVDNGWSLTQPALLQLEVVHVFLNWNEFYSFDVDYWSIGVQTFWFVEIVFLGIEVVTYGLVVAKLPLTDFGNEEVRLNRGAGDQL